MKVSEAIEILKTLDQDKELITAWHQDADLAITYNTEWLFNRYTKIDHKFFGQDNFQLIKEHGLNPNKIIVIS